MSIVEIVEKEREKFREVLDETCKYLYYRLKSSSPIEYSKIKPLSLEKILVDIRGLKELKELLTKLLDELRVREGKHLILYIAPFGGSKSQSFEYVKEIVKSREDSDKIVEFSFSSSSRLLGVLKSMVLSLSAILLSSGELEDYEKTTILEVLAEYKILERSAAEGSLRSYVEDFLPLISSLVSVANKEKQVLLIQVDECDLWYGNYERYRDFGKLFRELYDRADRIIFILYATTEAYYQFRKWSSLDPFLNRSLSTANIVASPGKYLDKVIYALARLAVLTERVNNIEFSREELELLLKIVEVKKLGKTLDIRRCNLMIINFLEKLSEFNKYKLIQIGKELYPQHVEEIPALLAREVFPRIPGLNFTPIQSTEAEGVFEIGQVKIPLKIIVSQQDKETLKSIAEKHNKVIAINVLREELTEIPNVSTLEPEPVDLLYPLVGIVHHPTLSSRERELLLNQYASFFRIATELDTLIESEIIRPKAPSTEIEARPSAPLRLEEKPRVERELALLTSFIQSWRSIKTVCKFMGISEKEVKSLVEKYRKYFYIKGNRIYRRK
ncbi:MAG: hypothetical protein DRJ52_06885 [Thermoprotei archaeon]|nr:MAG: hypothetical protein DRJ52_06885 [Thermoprotei archaeon]RLF00652.1 MAG: hypothetical protein DRJ63_01810 [Thermoprotei archaeon]HDI74794.1 hypothetical protein [Thermoprotei archaeon]